MGDRRDRIAAAFERELARSPMPPDLREQVVRGAIHHQDEPALPRRQWALALVAMLLAIAVVATLIGVRALHSVAPTPARHGPPLTLHHNGLIVVGGKGGLTIIDPATGSRHTMLSVPAGLELTDAAYSSDGTQLAYMSGSASTPGGRSIWVQDTRTGHTRQLTVCQECQSASHLSWSPDGSRLAFSDGNPGLQIAGSQIYLVDADGTHRVQLTHFPAVRYASQPSWSSDGTRIAFTSQGTIDVIRTDGSELAVVLADENGASDPAWSPDGSRIAYVLDPRSPQGAQTPFEYQLWLMDPDGSHRTKIFVSPGCCVAAWGGPAWSPDGHQIAVVAYPPSGPPSWGLWTMNADGSNPLSLGQVDADRPTWQPVP